LNVAVADQRIKYPGPVLLFRRTRDEVISLEPGNLEKNRGNDLLINLLQYRYPRVIDSETLPTLRDWLGTEGGPREALIRKFRVDDGPLIHDLQQYIKEHGASFPMLIGDTWFVEKKTKMTLYLARKHMIDFDSTHCTPLPTELFHFPQDEIGLKSVSSSDVSDFVEIITPDGDE